MIRKIAIVSHKIGMSIVQMHSIVAVAEHRGRLAIVEERTRAQVLGERGILGRHDDRLRRRRRELVAAWRRLLVHCHLDGHVLEVVRAAIGRTLRRRCALE